MLLPVGVISPRWGRGLANRLIIQICALGLTALLLPLVGPLIASGARSTGLLGTRVTQIASLLATMTALLAFRRVTAYPGARGFAYIIPTFSITFGITAAVLLVLRLKYSGSMLIIGYLATTVAMFLLWYYGGRGAPRRMFFVPGGDTSLVADTPQIEWVALMRPEMPATRDGAIVADLRWDHGPAWERLLAEAAISGRAVYHTKQLHESLTGRVQIEHLSENSFGSLLPNRAYHGIKRAIDIAACLLLLPVLAIPMMIVALLIRLGSPGSALFRQERMGFRGKPFRVLKFRTMRGMPPASGLRGGRAGVLLHDESRITPLGRFLRKMRIDELPQIVNVLRGEMSWIGPRPEAFELSVWYESELPFYSYRHIVRPGITGWAQVNQGHVAELTDVHLKLHYDFYYIKHYSAWLDVLIAMRTCATILTGFGAR